MLHFEWYACFTAVGTHPVPFLKEVFAHLVALQCPLLVLDPADFRVLHLLRVELDQLLDEPTDWHQFLQALDHGLDVVDHTAHGRWQPAFGPAAVGEARLAVARLPAAPRTAHLAA